MCCRQLRAPMRKSSSTSTDSNDVSAVQCLQHGSGVDIVDLIKDNIGAQLAPMLNALCNDPSLRSSCTCNHSNDTVQWTPPTTGTPNYSTTRRLSLSHPLSAWESHDQPGTVARPYSWASEQGGGQLQLPAVDVDALSGSRLNPPELVTCNGGTPMHSGLALVHRHSDAAVYPIAHRMNAERIMANH